MLALADARLVSAAQTAYDERSRWTSSRFEEERAA